MEKTRYEEFIESYEDDRDKVRQELKDKGVYDFQNYFIALEEFQNKVNASVFVYLFGSQLGEHLWEKFVNQSGRNAIRRLSTLTSEYRFFILHEIKVNKYLYFQ